jgi:hypothetical protein
MLSPLAQRGTTKFSGGTLARFVYVDSGNMRPYRLKPVETMYTTMSTEEAHDTEKNVMVEWRLWLMEVAPMRGCVVGDSRDCSISE